MGMPPKPLPPPLPTRAEPVVAGTVDTEPPSSLTVVLLSSNSRVPRVAVLSVVARASVSVRVRVSWVLSAAEGVVTDDADVSAAGTAG